MSTLVEIKTEDEWNTHTAQIPSHALQIIYFKAEWAKPCHQMTTVLQTLASSYPLLTPPTTAWLALDAEELADISELFDVTAVPYVVLRRGETVLESISGTDATKVRVAVEKHIKAPSSTSTSASTTQGVGASTHVPSQTTTAPAPQTAPAVEHDHETTETKEQIRERVAALVKAAPVMLFMKGTPNAPQCGFSRKLVGILREHSVKFGFFNILADDAVRQGLKEFGEWPTYPQLWMNGELMGGLDVVVEDLQNDPDYLKPYSVSKTA